MKITELPESINGVEFHYVTHGDYFRFPAESTPYMKLPHTSADHVHYNAINLKIRKSISVPESQKVIRLEIEEIITRRL